MEWRLVTASLLLGRVEQQGQVGQLFVKATVVLLVAETSGKKREPLRESKSLCKQRFAQGYAA